MIKNSILILTNLTLRNVCSQEEEQCQLFALIKHEMKLMFGNYEVACAPGEVIFLTWTLLMEGFLMTFHASDFL